MRKLVLAVMAVVLGACSTIPNYRSLAKQVVPTNVELLATIINPLSETTSDKAYCSGVAVSPQHIITAGHCVEGARSFPEDRGQALFDGKMKIRTYDGKILLAKIIFAAFNEDGPAEARDVALLVLDEPVLDYYAELGDSSELQVGDQLAIVGNSFGELTYSFTIGVVSYLDRELAVGYFIQTDALSAGGNSGGPVFNMRGQLVGILVRGGGGISLALPLKDVLKHIHLGLKKNGQK